MPYTSAPSPSAVRQLITLSRFKKRRNSVNQDGTTTAHDGSIWNHLDALSIFERQGPHVLNEKVQKVIRFHKHREMSPAFDGDKLLPRCFDRG